ncbi:MAG: S-layer homology domain-containing protein, partial [Firmicutes bacterium]|nr:S-layer homology domain-containing protein [Bacillota bacterium]
MVLKKGGVKFFASLMIVAMVLSLVPLQAMASPSDIQGHWAQAQIQSWLDRGLAAGYPDGSFRPDSQVTRAEFAALFNRAFKTPAASKDPGFTDVPKEAWYYGEVAAAAAAGIVSGYPDKT